MTTKISLNGVDIDQLYVTTDYLLDVYPEISIATPSLLMCGYNTNGQLGDGTNANKSSLVQTSARGTNWKHVSAGASTTASIKQDGTLWTWGQNSVGQLGHNTRTKTSFPLQVFGGGTNWKQVSCGGYYMAAIKTNGTMWCWGFNPFGNLGVDDTNSRSSPTQVSGGGTDWKQVSVGEYFSLALKTDGSLWSCGYNANGQLGDGTTTSRSSLTQVTGDWLKIACGAKHSIAIRNDNTLWLCGYNANGQLGDGTTTSRSSLTQVTGGGQWKSIGGGSFSRHTTAIKQDGTLWLWGDNTYGQLGDGTTTSRSSPVQTIAGGTNWKQVACGFDHTGAIKTDGTLWVWGYNNYGQLGQHNTVNRSSPIQVGVSAAWKSVAAGYEHTALITSSTGGL